MSGYNPKIHNRRSIRLKGYDYSKAGLYFITICVQDREHLFGEVIDGEMVLNDAGKMARTEWLKLPERFKNIKLHEFVVMPNHFHGIIVIHHDVTAPVGAGPRACPKQGQPRGDGQPRGVAPTIGARDLRGLYIRGNNEHGPLIRPFRAYLVCFAGYQGDALAFINSRLRR